MPIGIGEIAAELAIVGFFLRHMGGHVNRIVINYQPTKIIEEVT